MLLRRAIDLPVIHRWFNKSRGMCYPVSEIVHIIKKKIERKKERKERKKESKKERKKCRLFRDYIGIFLLLFLYSITTIKMC